MKNFFLEFWLRITSFNSGSFWNTIKIILTLFTAYGGYLKIQGVATMITPSLGLADCFLVAGGLSIFIAQLGVSKEKGAEIATKLN